MRKGSATQSDKAHPLFITSGEQGKNVTKRMHVSDKALQTKEIQ